MENLTNNNNTLLKFYSVVDAVNNWTKLIINFNGTAGDLINIIKKVEQIKDFFSTVKFDGEIIDSQDFLKQQLGETISTLCGFAIATAGQAKAIMNKD